MESNFAYSVVLSSKAAKEIQSSWDWYESRQQGLGDKFVEELLR